MSESDARQQQQRLESDLTGIRAQQLHLNPIKGIFDLVHLQAIHAYIFQDLPHHQPGVTRSGTDNWTKRRALEARPERYAVPYLSKGVGKRIAAILKQFGGACVLRGLTLDAAARELCELYGDLDHAHGFYEGNSRTLREFTRELSLAAGFILDWTGSSVAARQRNALYVARDVAVYARAFPGLDEARAMATKDRREYEAFLTLEKLRKLAGKQTLEQIIRKGLRRDEAAGKPA